MPQVKDAPIQNQKENSTGSQPKGNESPTPEVKGAKEFISKGIAPELPPAEEGTAGKEGQPNAGEPHEGEESFYTGDPQTLPQELKPIYNSMLTDYKRKTAELKEKGHAVTADLKSQAIREALDNLTEQDMEVLASHPKFMQVLPAYLQSKGVQIPGGQNGSADGFDPSTATDTERLLYERNKLLEKELGSLKTEIGQIKQTNHQATVASQDANLRAKYGNIYRPEVVDSFLQEVVSGRRRLDREFIHKAIDYEPAIKRAYEYGRRDAYDGAPEKERASFLSSFSSQGSQTYEVPQQQPRENIRDYMMRLAENARNNLAQGKTSPFLAGENSRTKK